MIRYTLKCSNDHSFESWFKSAGAFDALLAAGHVACPTCGDANVSKAMMTPGVSTARGKADRPLPENAMETGKGAPPNAQSSASSHEPEGGLPAPVEAPDPSATSLSPAEKEQTIAKIRQHVEDNSDYVGDKFSEQARAMHDGDAPARAIYGEANIDEAKALLEDGVPVVPLPFKPKRKMN